MFKITAENSGARAGILKTKHGSIETPFFMPVATKGAVKYVDNVELLATGTNAIISNSLVLYFRPGLKVIKNAHGLHSFANWNRIIFTDSGGFQSGNDFFLEKTTDRGAYFKSPFDGTKHMITPEKAVEIQSALGSDVMMVLDDMPGYGLTKAEVIAKTKRTHKWAERSMARFDKEQPKEQMIFGIAQGGHFSDLRKDSINFISNLGFDGIALGGLAIGEPRQRLYNTLKQAAEHLPYDKPHYLMGVGNPADIMVAVENGIDCFDSTYPTQNARHMTLFTSEGRLMIKNKRYETDFGKIDKNCDCYVCRNFSRAYLHHIMKRNEPTGMKLASYHNIYFMQTLMHRTREAIKAGTFTEFSSKIKQLFGR